VPETGVRSAVAILVAIVVFGPLSCARVPIAASDSSRALLADHPPAQKPPGPTRVAPAASYLHYVRGYLQELAGHDDAALAEYAKALQVDPDSVALRHHAASLAFKQGRYEDGIRFAEEVLRRDPDHLPTLFLLGRWYAGTTDHVDRAVELFEHMTALEPDKAEPYLNLGLLYGRLERYADAERVIRRAIEIEPNAPAAYLYLGKVAAGQHKWEQAVVQFEKAIELAPFFEHAYIALGDLYAQRGDRAKAVGVYKRLLAKVDPHDAEAVGRLVQLYLKERTFDQAIELLDELLRGDPKNVEARLLKGRIYGEMGKPAEAIAELEQVIAARPTDTAALYYLGRLYDEQKQPEKAIVQFEKIVSLDVDLLEAYLQLGLLYARAKRFDEASAVVEKARSKDAERPEVYLVAGFVYSQSERYDRAAEIFKEGLAKYPDHPQLHFNLGLTYDKLKQFDGFVKELEEAIRLDPQYSEALNYLGYTYAEKEMKLPEAVDLIQRALAIKPDDGAYIDSLGWAHFKLGQWDDALKELERAASLMPDDAVIQEHLGEAYLKKQRDQDARESWLKSLELDPANVKLIERYKSAGFGDPEAEERIQRAKAKKDAEKPATMNQNVSERAASPSSI